MFETVSLSKLFVFDRAIALLSHSQKRKKKKQGCIVITYAKNNNLFQLYHVIIGM